MSEHRRYSGPDLATLLRRVDDELGSNAVIVDADRVRTGGFAGFFAREHYEVVASRSEAEDVDPPSTVVPHGVDLEADDELISASPAPSRAGPPRWHPGESRQAAPVARHAGSAARSAVLPPLKPLDDASPAPLPDTVSVDPPPVPETVPVDPPPGRSIQAALLDRADQVSTEELLARAAEPGAVERAGESFRSILGRAVATTPETAPDSQSIGSDRPEQRQVEARPAPAEEPIIGLRPERVRPGEHVIDPLPEKPPIEERHPDAPRLSRLVGADGAEPSTGSSDPRFAGPYRSPESDRIGSNGVVPNGWHVPQQAGSPPSWPNPGGPPWTPPWPQGWPHWPTNEWPHWPTNGWPVTPPTVHPPTAHSCPCPMCAQPVPTPAIDSAVLINSLPVDSHGGHRLPMTAAGWSSSDPETTMAWSDIRREIDETIRYRIDDIVQALRQAAAGTGCDCSDSHGAASASLDRPSPGDRPPPPQRPYRSHPLPDRRRRLSEIED